MTDRTPSAAQRATTRRFQRLALLLLVVGVVALGLLAQRGAAPAGGESAAAAASPGTVGATVAAPDGTATTGPATARTTTRATATRTTTAATSTATRDPYSGLPWVDVADLPEQARTVLATIDRGGPYAYDKDGTVFRNAEGRLPKAATGYYREYTVVLPGSPDRGPLRIVVGGGEYFYWTDDHYATFSRIRR